MASEMIYTAEATITNPTASTTQPTLQLTLATGHPLTIRRLEITQESITASTVASVLLATSTAVAAGTLANANGLIVKNEPSNPTSQFTMFSSGITGAGTGTQAKIFRKGFNVVSGLLYLPVPEEIIEIPATAANFLFLMFPVAPAATYNISLVVGEGG